MAGMKLEELTDEEVEWLLDTLGLVMQLARKWDNLQGDDRGQQIVNKLMYRQLIKGVINGALGRPRER